MMSLRAPALLASLALTLALPALAQEPPDERHSDGVVAVVGSESITRHDLELACRLHPAYLELESPRERAEFRRLVLDESSDGQLGLIVQKALVQRAKAEGIELAAEDEARLSQDLLRVAARQHGGMEGLRQALQRIGVPFEYFVARKRENLLIAKLLQAKLPPAPDEADEDERQALRDAWIAEVRAQARVELR